MVKEVARRGGRLDYVVSNAAINPFMPWDDDLDRGLRRAVRDQCARRLGRLHRGREADDRRGPWRRHRHDQLDLGPCRRADPGRLLRHQGRHQHARQGARLGARRQRHPRQRDRAGRRRDQHERADARYARRHEILPRPDRACTASASRPNSPRPSPSCCPTTRATSPRRRCWSTPASSSTPSFESAHARRWFLYG